MKKRIKSRGVAIVVYGFAAVLSAIIVFTGVKVIPKGVIYTVKQQGSSDNSRVMSASVEQAPRQIAYTVQAVDNKVLVFYDGAVVKEIYVNTANLSRLDRQRLANGITVYSDNELLVLTEYLES